MNYLKFLLYVATAIVLWHLASIRDRDAVADRYHFISTDDGEIIEFDSATGKAWTIHSGSKQDTFRHDYSNDPSVPLPQVSEM